MKIKNNALAGNDKAAKCVAKVSGSFLFLLADFSLVWAVGFFFGKGWIVSGMFRWDCYVVKQTAQCTNL